MSTANQRRSLDTPLRVTLGLCCLLQIGLTGHARASERSPPPMAEGVQSELIEAIRGRDESAFETALSEGADPGSIAVNEKEAWALCAAAIVSGRTTDLYFLERLLEAGADPNALSPVGSVLDETALACALSALREDAVRLLMDAGADDSLLMCADCLSPETPFSVALTGSRWFVLEVMERRELSPLELQRLNEDLRFEYMKGKTYHGRPMREYFESYLRERGLVPIKWRQ